jgi:hypothetical protein
MVLHCFLLLLEEEINFLLIERGQPVSDFEDALLDRHLWMPERSQQQASNKEPACKLTVKQCIAFQ